jgi:co-chaperonin GroES (HSP10)
MTPLKANVLVQLDSRNEVSKGGLHIPDISRGAEEWGVVVSVGDKCKDLSEGDRVLVLRTQGTHYIQNKVDMVILAEQKVLAIDIG